MGNNMAYKTVGVGTIQLRMHDGVVRTLSGVRHVPDLKKNLMSLGARDSLGCKFLGGGGVLKVSRGALVLMKGQQRGNLYILQCSTITGAAATVASSKVSDSDLTHLWHMRLGHMSERGMTVLSKQGLLRG